MIVVMSDFWDPGERWHGHLFSGSRLSLVAQYCALCQYGWHSVHVLVVAQFVGLAYPL
jgi:hypothetical protein